MFQVKFGNMKKRVELIIICNGLVKWPKILVGDSQDIGENNGNTFST